MPESPEARTARPKRRRGRPRKDEPGEGAAPSGARRRQVTLEQMLEGRGSDIEAPGYQESCSHPERRHSGQLPADVSLGADS